MELALKAEDEFRPSKLSKKRQLKSGKGEINVK